MKAAVVESFDHPPRYSEFPEPLPQPDEVMITVKAAALSQLVRAQASGKHYTSGHPPMVPGADGVGVLDNGQRVYFAFPRGPVGAMAERVAVKRALIAPLPDDVDNVTAAAIANPGMSSWAALLYRAKFTPGQSVLINGATGTSGKLAIGIARHLGATRIVATGRNATREAALRALGADAFVPLDLPTEALVARFRQEYQGGVDVVLDYLGGASAEALLIAATGHGSDEAERRVCFVNIGSLTGATLSIPTPALRSSGLEIIGSGLGSVAKADLVKAIAGVFGAITPAALSVETTTAPLQDVSAAWSRNTGTARLVLTL